MNATEQLILIVEDEIKLAHVLRDYFINANYCVHCIDDGLAVEEWVKANHPQVILLDLNLPGKDGVEICKQLRTFTDVPILMVTARVDQIDRLIGLEIGADDYICKPFSPKEVVARVKAVLRRANAQLITTCEQLQLDAARNQATWGDKRIELTAIEYQLLEKLLGAPGHIFSRDQLMDNMYSDHRVVSGRTIDSHIKKLRKKLHELVEQHDPIKSVYGLGYKWEL